MVAVAADGEGDCSSSSNSPRGCWMSRHTEPQCCHSLWTEKGIVAMEVGTQPLGTAHTLLRPLIAPLPGCSGPRSAPATVTSCSGSRRA